MIIIMVFKNFFKTFHVAILFIILTLVGCESQDEKFIILAKNSVISKLVSPGSITFSNVYMIKKRLASADGHLFIYVCGTVNVKSRFYESFNNSRFIVIISAEEFLRVSSVMFESVINSDYIINKNEGDINFENNGWSMFCVE